MAVGRQARLRQSHGVRCDHGRLQNGLGECVDIENTCLYPMLKGSEVASDNRPGADRFMLVTQREIGEATDHIQLDAPKTWQYLQSHARLLDARRSSIYRKRPCFSVFGVGQYTFAPGRSQFAGCTRSSRFALSARNAANRSFWTTPSILCPVCRTTKRNLCMACLRVRRHGSFSGRSSFGTPNGRSRPRCWGGSTCSRLRWNSAVWRNCCATPRECGQCDWGERRRTVVLRDL